MAKRALRSISWVLALALVVSVLAPLGIRTRTAEAVTAVSFTISPLTANTAAQYIVSITVTTQMDAGVDDITIKFPVGTQLPASIAATNVTVGGGGNTIAQAPLNLAPTVDPTAGTVVVRIPSTIPAGTTFTNMTAGAVIVTFSVAAGIKNPITTSAASGVAATVSAGNAGATGEATLTGAAAVNTMARSVTFAVAAGPYLTAVTVLGQGFTPATTVTLTGGGSGSATVAADGSFSVAGYGVASAAIVATDGAGLATTGAAFAVLPSLTISPATGQAAGAVVLTGRNFTTTAGATNDVLPADILVGGAVIASANIITVMGAGLELSDLDTDGGTDDFLITILVPGNVTAGATIITVGDGGGANASLGVATASITAIGRVVTVTPSSGPPGTLVSFTATGYPANDAAAAANAISTTPTLLGSTTMLFTDGNGIVTGTKLIGAAAVPGTSVTITVSITGVDTVATLGYGTFTVTARPLTATPTSGPRGTVLYVTGAGFTASNEVDPLGVNAAVSGANGTFNLNGVGFTTAGQSAATDSAGNLPSLSGTVPAAAALGLGAITLTDQAGLAGAGEFTVTQPTIAASPASAVLGQAVTVTGSGWVPASSVTVVGTVAGTVVSTSTIVASSSGAFAANINVPTTASITAVGATLIWAAGDGATLGNTALPVYTTVLPASIALSAATATAGSSLTITGTGFVPSSALTVLTIGGASVLPATATISNSTGGFTVNVLVPGLTGTQLVTASVAGASRTASVVISGATTTVETQLTALITAGTLVSAWNFNNTTGAWALFMPNAPAGVNDLTVYTIGDAAVIVTSAAGTLSTNTFTQTLRSGINIFGWR
ncbi:MAG: hypothetical protein EXR48_06655 [Dehalococcoidia bacterium]|nr:hypothetical protein [Dehalococcoidia bacterium]